MGEGDGPPQPVLAPASGQRLRVNESKGQGARERNVHTASITDWLTGWPAGWLTELATDYVFA